MIPATTSRLSVSVAAACLMLAACNGSGDLGLGSTLPESTTSTATAAPVSSSTTATTAPGRSDRRNEAEATVAEAVDALAESGVYGFEATITLTIEGEDVVIELEGWVDGEDRELVTRVGTDEVITRVVDGVATIERDEQITEVPLAEANDAPSIEILKMLQQPKLVSATEVTGKLSATDLRASGFDLNGAANVTIYLASDLSLSGYRIEANNEALVVDVSFTDIGA